MIKKRSIPAILVMILMIVAAFSKTAVPAQAEEVVPEAATSSIVLGANDSLGVTANQENAAIIRFADNDWYLASYNKKGNEKMAADGVMSLFSVGFLPDDSNEPVKSAFNNEGGTNEYKDSLLQKNLNTLFKNRFSKPEQKAVKERTLEVGEYNDVNWPQGIGIAGSKTTGYLWPLSLAEVVRLNGRLFEGPTNESEESLFWSTRSPYGNSNQYVIAAFGRDAQDYSNSATVEQAFPIRPAFHLNPDSILLTCTEYGKTYFEDYKWIGAVNFESHVELTFTLTLKDDARKNFAINPCEVKYNNSTKEVTVPYSGALTGKNEFISALIVDKDNNIKYYSRVAKVSSASGTVRFNLEENGDSIFENTDKLYVFNEQYNSRADDGEELSVVAETTSYGSELMEVPIPSIGHDFSTKVTYKWSADNKKVTASRVCKRDKRHVQSETVNTTAKVTKKPTCTNKGETTYTAVFKNKAFASTKKTVKNIKATGHRWGKWNVILKPAVGKVGKKQRVCKNNPSHVQKKIISAHKGKVVLGAVAVGKKTLRVSWNKMEGANGYDIFLAKCNDNHHKRKGRLTRTFNNNRTFTCLITGLKEQTAYKLFIKTWVYVDKKKEYVRTSPLIHVFTSGFKRGYTNPAELTIEKNAVSLKPKDIYKIKATITKVKQDKKLMGIKHGPKLRYVSDNKKVADVSRWGNIRAKGKGSCNVHVFTVNGLCKTITVTVN